ncbi:MAG: hypothetical protein PUJ60_06430 [bacterium]|nr:hypothetical protein [Clostridium sp.]MDD7630650.1 hypothetical protein [bacterium]MDY4109259.1 hypothetical protein [Bacilli bacterium]
MKKIKYLLLLIPFLFISKVNGATYEYQIFGGVNDSEFGIEANGSRISTGDKFIFFGKTMNNYMYVDICTTGNKPSTWVYDARDGSLSVSTQVLKVNKRCVVSGYEAQVYRFTFFVASASDIGQDRLGLNFTTRLFNETSYYTYMRILSVFGSDTLSYADIEAGQNEAIQQQQQEANQKLNDINNSIKNQTEEQKKTNDTLKDNNIQGAQNSAGGFFNDFTTDTHGLTAIITAPLSLISKITSSSCNPLVLPLPFVDKDLTLPCMGAIYSNYFGSFLSIYQLITFGIVAYWVCVRIFNLVKDFKNPDHDEIEVLDL